MLECLNLCTFQLHGQFASMTVCLPKGLDIVLAALLDELSSCIWCDIRPDHTIRDGNLSEILSASSRCSINKWGYRWNLDSDWQAQMKMRQLFAPVAVFWLSTSFFTLITSPCLISLRHWQPIVTHYFLFQNVMLLLPVFYFSNLTICPYSP